MSLRKKTLLIIVITLVFLFGLLFGLSQWLLHSSYQTLETQKTAHTADQAKAAVGDQVENLARSLNDWSRWDDSHQFALDQNQTYKESNLHANSFETLKLNSFHFISPEGKVIWEDGFDLKESTVAPPLNLKGQIESGQLLNRADDTENKGVSGVLMVKGAPWLLGARPLLKSDGTGPISGTLIWGRAFNQAEVEALATKTRLTIHILPITPELPANFAQALSQIQAGTEFPVIPLNEEQISGYDLLKDIYGKPALLIQVVEGRDIHAQGKETLKYLLTALFFCAVIFGVVIIQLINHQVLGRLLALVQGVKEVDQNHDLHRRMPISGKDEITSLAQSINAMLVNLERSEEALLVRNQETADILDNVGQGILTVGPDLLINPEFSAFTTSIFGQSPAGANLAELLFETELEKTDYVEWAQMVFNPDRQIATDSVLEMAKSEIRLLIDGKNKVLSLQYQAIYDLVQVEQVKKLMVVITDITRQREVEQRAKKEKEEHEQIVKILRDQDSFFSFLHNARIILSDSREMLSTLASNETGVLSNLFRGMHTIKGTAAAFSIKSVASHSHEIENVFADIQKGKIQVNDVLVTNLRQEVGEVISELEAVVTKVSELLGEPFGQGRKVFKIREDKLDAFSLLIKSLPLEANVALALNQELRKLRRIPAGRAFRMYANNLDSLAERTSKLIEPLVIQNGDLEIDLDLVKVLDAPLMHLLRNAVDHGVEAPEDRVMLGKPEEGRISLGFEETKDHLEVTLGDDGQGIDPERIRTIAVKRGVLDQSAASQLSDQEAIMLIFKPSFSTKEEASDISGRGVGMDVVKTEIEGHGGQVLVSSILGEGTTTKLLLPLPKL